MKKTLLVMVLLVALVSAACSDDDGTANDDSSATDATSDTGAAGRALATMETDLGTIVVDADGMTLYMFMSDDQGPSVCNDECAGNWPPLTGNVTAGEGLEPSLLGTATRDDGSEQPTYGGWPLYYFAADAAAGDVNGQGVGDVWFVISANGEPIQ